MDFQKFAYDACRCFLQDRKGLILEVDRMRILGWVRARDIAKLSSCSDHFPQAFADVELNRVTRQVSAFFKKNAAFTDDELCDKAAESTFLKGERLCRITNRRLDHFYAHPHRIDEELQAAIRRAEDIVTDVLGDFEDFLDDLPKLVRVTPGATSTRPRKKALPYLKIGKRHIPCSASAQPYITALARFFGYGDVTFENAETNRVETVPKNWKTARTIACEPEGNQILQLAFDAFVKKLLLKIGVNLADQSKNQEMSRLASINDDFVTVDLSMASDTVAYNAVGWLFPIQWFKFLCDVRSPKGAGFGQHFEYAKFSSMGNGATFGVETLIFAALCKSTGAEEFAVYGDDIVIHKRHYPLLHKLLAFFGFSINDEKSFTDGPFRESCGTDWFDGVNVTPFYLRTHTTMKVEVVHLVNGLAALATPGGQLSELLATLVATENLPLVPYQDSTISGVWIDTHSAYTEKLIRSRSHRPTFKRLKNAKGETAQTLEVVKTNFVPKGNSYDGVPKYKAFVPKTKDLSIYDSRTSFLWHLDAYKRSFNLPVSNHFNHALEQHYAASESVIGTSCIIRSMVPIFSHKFVRKWVCWNPPATATPAHLYWWSDVVLRASREPFVEA